MFRPHHPKHAQFGPVGVAAQAPHDFIEIRRGEPLLLHLGSDFRQGLFKGGSPGGRGGNQGQPDRGPPQCR